MDFFGIGPLELLLILLVIFMVMGPERLPQISRKLGEFIAQARGTVNQAQDAFMRDVEMQVKDAKAEVKALRDEATLFPPEGQVAVVKPASTTPGLISPAQSPTATVQSGIAIVLEYAPVAPASEPVKALPSEPSADH